MAADESHSPVKITLTLPDHVPRDIQCIAVIAQALAVFKLGSETELAVLHYLCSRVIQPEIVEALG